MALQACAGTPTATEPARPPVPAAVIPEVTVPAMPAPVLGPDGELVVNALEYPWSAIGRLNTGGRSYCTGVLISARQVLAPAACLQNEIEGRPWVPSELHFVAGYQRDAYSIHAPAASYETPPGFVPGAATLANAANFWAVVTLSQPIGEEAGWLGLVPLDAATREAVDQGPAVLFQAGYRRETPHVVTAFVGCATGPGCRNAPADPDLPFLLFRGSAFHVAVSAAPGSGESGSHAPQRLGAAAAVPGETVDALLRYLGYLDSTASPPDPAQRRLAIARFQDDAGLAVTGEVSVALLGALIRTIRTGTAPEVS